MTRLLSTQFAELSAYLDGELDDLSAARLRERLASDPALAAGLRELADLGEELRAIRRSEISPAHATRMRERLAAERGRAEAVPLRRPATPHWGGRAALCAAAALAAALALALLMRAQISGGPEPQIAAAPEPVIPGGRPLEERAIHPLREREFLAPRLRDPPESLPAPGPQVPFAPARPRPELRPPAPAPAPGRIAVEVPDAIEGATDEELLLALELEAVGAEAERAEDLAIIEDLEFVERLRALEGRGRRG